MTGERTILVVDDEPDLRMLVRMLAGRDHTVLEAAAGEQAIELLASRTDIDILLLDIRMPGMDGFEVIERLESLDLLRDLHVIAFSAHAERAVVDRMAVRGVHDFLRKPFTGEDLRHVLAQAGPDS